MDLNRIFSSRRTVNDSGKQSNDPRSQYQRDFDRIIFSSSFRRLQNKTQVFPLPGSKFVHTRLTHSLEVASVGRSMGSLIGDFIVKTYGNGLTPEARDFYQHNLYNVISSACLCHDIGNPAFGHSGEDAIANFFVEHESGLRARFSEAQWADFVHFEGNANAIRVLTHEHSGKSQGGLLLTYATLCAIIKYPCESRAREKNVLHRKKFGFFEAERDVFESIAVHTGMVQESADPLVFKRHPFVWLVEAADDICYTIVDLEDAQRLQIIDYEACYSLFRSLIEELGVDDSQHVQTRLDRIADKNDRISYLRAKAINALTVRATGIYKNHFEDILSGNFFQSLLGVIKNECPALKKIEHFSIDNIYQHRSVIEIENAGFHIMNALLTHLVFPTLLEPAQRRAADKKALQLIPSQFQYEGASDYTKVLGVLDYVSGMTDNYAASMYKKIKGIDIGMTF